MQGYVYILMNPSLKGLLKVRKTTRTPQERADELSANTNMPTPFMVVHEEFCSDCDTAEYLIHEELSERGYRVNDLREFFSSTLKETIEIFSSIVPYINANSKDIDEESYENIPEAISDGTDSDLAWHYYKLGEAAYHGEECFQDYQTALSYYEKAGKLGWEVAYCNISDIYRSGGYGVKKSFQKAIQYAKLAGETGYAWGYYKLFDLYIECMDIKNAEYAFGLYLNNTNWENYEEFSHETLALSDYLEYVQEFIYSETFKKLVPQKSISQILGFSEIHKSLTKIIDIYVNNISYHLENYVTLRKDNVNILNLEYALKRTEHAGSQLASHLLEFQYFLRNFVWQDCETIFNKVLNKCHISICEVDDILSSADETKDYWEEIKAFLPIRKMRKEAKKLEQKNDIKESSSFLNKIKELFK